MKNILILSDDKTFHKVSDKYRIYYEELSKIWLDKNVQLIRSNSYSFDVSNLIFKTWEYFDWQDWKSITNFSPDCIWYKDSNTNYFTKQIEKNYYFRNPTEFVYLKWKYTTYIVFEKFMAYTRLLSEFKLNKSLLDNFVGDKIVIKKIYGFGWKSVYLINKSEIDDFISKVDDTDNYIVQQFVDFSCWIKWLVDWIHDIRFLVIWDSVPFITIRVPTMNNEFRCNLWQWGKAFYTSIELLPKELLDIFNEINNNLRQSYWKLIYALDFAKWCDGKYYLIELNTAPWVDLWSFDKNINNLYFNKIIEFFN